MWIWIAFTGCRDVTLETEDGTNTSETETSICEADSDCPGGTICEELDGFIDCIDGDRNNEPAEAVSILWEDSIGEFINPSGDLDYFTFSARGGEHVRIVTTSDFEDADTVMVLRDETGQVLTWSDDFPTGSSVTSLDSVIYAHLPYEGEYLISVEDYYGYMDPEDAYGSRSYEYTLNLSMWTQATQEPNDMETPLTMELSDTNMWNSVGFVMDSDEDSDWLEIQYSAKDDDGNDAKFLSIAGMVNIDGSALTPVVRLYNAEQELLAEIDNVGPDGTVVYPNMTEGTYYVELVDANGGGSVEHWTYLFLIARSSTPYPLDNEGNLMQSNAQSIEMVPLQTDGGSDYAVGRQMGYLNNEGESQWYSMEHNQEGGQVIACLNSTLHGSTALPMVELYDAEGTLLSDATCDPDADPNLALILDEVPTGLLYWSVSSEQDTISMSDWYQMLVYSTSFEASSYACP
jgi:hypothetical protein